MNSSANRRGVSRHGCAPKKRNYTTDARGRSNLPRVMRSRGKGLCGTKPPTVAVEDTICGCKCCHGRGFENIDAINKLQQPFNNNHHSNKSETQQPSNIQAKNVSIHQPVRPPSKKDQVEKEEEDASDTKMFEVYEKLSFLINNKDQFTSSSPSSSPPSSHPTSSSSPSSSSSSSLLNSKIPSSSVPSFLILPPHLHKVLLTPPITPPLPLSSLEPQPQSLPSPHVAESSFSLSPSTISPLEILQGTIDYILDLESRLGKTMNGERFVEMDMR